MPRLPWFRVYTEILDDPKMARLSGDQFRDWIYVLAMARESETPGVIPMTIEDAAWRCRRSPDEFRRSLELFARPEMDMVTLSADSIQVTHFAERQKDKPSDLPERVKERVKRHRERQRNADETPLKRPSNAESVGASRQGNAGEVDRDSDSDRDSEERVPAPPPPDVTTQEREILKALQEIKSHSFDFETDLGYVRKWLIRFPQLNLLDEIDRCVTWWMGPRAPRKPGRANWRSRIRNWLQNADDRRKEREARERGQTPGRLLGGVAGRADQAGNARPPGYYSGLVAARESRGGTAGPHGAPNGG